MGDPEDLLAEARARAAAREPADLDLSDLRRRARRYERRKRAARTAIALAPVLAVIPLLLSGPPADDRLDLAEQPDADVAPPATEPAPPEPTAAPPPARPVPPPPARPVPRPLASAPASPAVPSEAPVAPVPPAAGDPEPPGGWIEAENGVLTPPMAVHLEAGAADAPSTPSGGAFVTVPDSATDGSSPLEARPGAVDLDIAVPEAGTYLIWARVRATGHGSNSFFVTVDDGDDDYWWLPPLDSPDWRWLPVTERGPLTPRRYELAAGPHRLRFGNREDGVALDRVLVTSDPLYVPVGPDAGP